MIHLQPQRPSLDRRQYALPHRVYLYRHTAATGLTGRRKANLCSVLDSMIEQVETVQISGVTILRAIGAYSCLTKDGDWIEPTRRVIVNRSRQSASPASSLQRRKSNRYSELKMPQPHEKKTNRYKSRFLHSDSGRDTLW